jgi:hypothetical protein
MRSTLRINASNNRAMDRDCFPDIRKKSVAMCRDVKFGRVLLRGRSDTSEQLNGATEGRLQFVQFNPKDRQRRPRV